MLSEKGGQALLDFTAKTNTVIVTVNMSDDGLERLDILLQDWQSDPSIEKELKIIEGFAITEDLTDRTRVPDKY